MGNGSTPVSAIRPANTETTAVPLEFSAAARRGEERAIRLLRGVREMPREAVDEDHGAAVGHREGVPPQP